MKNFKIDKKTKAIVSVVFGLAIFFQPSILNILVAVYLIVSGLLDYESA